LRPPQKRAREREKERVDRKRESEEYNMKGVLSLFSSEKIALDTENWKRIDDYANVRCDLEFHPPPPSI
jgi:hypothetical protein